MNVVVWSTPGCPRCKGLMQQLKSKGIEFEDNNNADELVAKGFTTAPVLQVDDKFFVGKDIYTWMQEH